MSGRSYADAISAHKADPLYAHTVLNHIYSATTVNSNLRGHMENYHEDQYVSQCELNGWPIQLVRRRVRENALRQSTLNGIAHAGECSPVHYYNN